MSLKHIYSFVLTIIFAFILLFACDFLGENNPLRIFANEINQYVYNRGGK